MFARKKDSATITEKDPVFEVRYLGNVETFSANGKGCAIIPVRKLWENSQSERHLKKILVAISATGIIVRSSKKDEGKKFGIENITFCNADKSANERIFCWIWKVPGVSRLECHAALCRSRETAQAMALVLSRAFQLAYRDWRANKGRQIRQRKNSLFQERHSEDLVGISDKQDRRGSSDVNGRQVQGDSRVTRQDYEGERGMSRQNSGENEVTSHKSELLPENCLNDKRRASSASSTSGFASSLILDPEDEEWIQSDARVQAIVSGDMGDSDHGSD